MGWGGVGKARVKSGKGYGYFLEQLSIALIFLTFGVNYSLV